MSRTLNRQGLVLLVVLGMLALFSLLTVTYVLFASQSRSASIALSRRSSFQASSTERPQFMFDEAIKQLIRGTTDSGSEMWGQSILEDFYGANETSTLGTQSVRASALAGGSMTHVWNNVERPMLIGNRFLRIPVPSVGFPAESDVLNGRIITFPAGQGPLEGLSFHIVRYVGDQGSNSNGCNYTITIDLQEIDLTRTHSQAVGTGGGNQTNMTGTIADWALRFPVMTGSPSSGPWAAGVYLCYETVGLNPQLPVLQNPYSFIINAVPLNSHGMGVLADGSNQYHVLDATATNNVIDPAINAVPAGLQLRSKELGNNAGGTINRLFDPDVAQTAQVLLNRQFQWGDTDEPIDAADFNTSFLAFRPSGAQNSGDIIPSFHRTALINYLVNFKDPATYTEQEFWAVLRRIELVVLRPLSLKIRTPSGVPAFMNSSKIIAGEYVTNPDFNPTGAALSDPINASRGIPPLVLNISGAWNTNWNPAGVAVFKNWLDRLIVGAWDIDNLASGKSDSVLIDIGLPLQDVVVGGNSKTLKTLVAYYVECLDSKLDVNATGGLAQANMYGEYFGYPTASFPTSATAATRFAKGNLNSGKSVYLYQGLGYGSGETSMRHLFGKPYLNFGDDGAELAYRNLLSLRYSSGSLPGAPGFDAISRLNLRIPDTPSNMPQYPTFHRHRGLPGLPLSVRGRASIALDRLGNPTIHNESSAIDVTENEYQARLISASYQDAPFGMSDWEHIYRLGDSDRSGTPDRLQLAFGESETTILTSALRHEITARSSHVKVPKIASRDRDFKDASNNVIDPPKSFFDLVNTIRRLKGIATPLTHPQYLDLFPIEFNRGTAMNLNRPLGNGVDDDFDGDIDEPLELTAAADGADNNSNGLVDEFLELWQSQSPYDASDITSVIKNTNLGMTYFAERTWIGDRGANRLDPDVTATAPNVRYMGEETRQLFARHLYSLAQLLVPSEYVFPNLDRGQWLDLLAQVRNSTPGAKERYIELRSRILAQWAVNVVDYRDSDSVMTRFPFDPDPLNLLGSGTVGWNPNRTIGGNSSTRIVWGMEQPELLLTESMALHDLRVRRDPTAPQPRIDQFRIPQGSLFLELYCPRSTGPASPLPSPTDKDDATIFPGVSRSLYNSSLNANVSLNLSKLTPAVVAGMNGNQPQYPVWRVYLSNPVSKTGASTIPKTPNERLTFVPPAPAWDSPSRFDLTYQLAKSNWVGGVDPGPSVSNGLIFDRTPTPANQLAEPDPNEARVILFTSDTAAVANTPGVSDPAQVFYNRSSSGIALEGNQYLVVGPRSFTTLGSHPDSKNADGTFPDNVPSKQSIDLAAGNWASLTDGAGAAFRSLSPTVKSVVTMIAGANPPSTWTNQNYSHVGINVSEPLPKNTGYYTRPTSQINSSTSSTTNDVTGQPLANPFHTLKFDGYHDYFAGGPAPAKAPLDDGTKGPLQFWSQNKDAAGTPLQVVQVGDPTVQKPVVKPGTAVDWSNAYLQRLADPDKPWHPSFNPYLTVDWMPIDLTVFSGEENDSEVGGTPTEMRLASRQKSGQMVDPTVQAFRAKNANDLGGQSFYSSLTHTPPVTARNTALVNFLKYEIPGDKFDTNTSTWSLRPTSCDNKFVASNGTFSTLGFLNSTFVLAAESGMAQLPALPTVTYPGAPADPFKSSVTWTPSAPFWTNRDFVNAFEIAYVPISGPGQLGQEFSAMSDNNRNIYGSAFAKPLNGATPYPQDPRMPNTVYSAGITVAQVPDAQLPGLQPNWQSNPRGPFTVDANSGSYYPFMHLLNFFQEPNEIDVAHQRYRGSGIAEFKHRHPKDSSLAMLFDMLDTPSAWADVENEEASSTFQYRDPSSMAQEFATVANASNAIFAPFRAPYNRLTRDVEPGRVQLNNITEANVLQGLWSNTLEPTDIDFAPYNPSALQANDIDHNGNGVLDSGSRITPNAISSGDMNNPGVWELFVRSRQGYDPISGFYTPPNASALDPNLPVRSFNPLYPTHFAGVFKPISEAGMSPQTCGRFDTTVAFSPRNPLTLPAVLPPTDAATSAQVENYVLADQYGLLDFHARRNPVHATLMRAMPGAANSLGIHEPTSATLFNDGGNTQRHPFTDLYPISRLQKLVTERSNVFAVYTTMALFEYDQATGNIGKEFGVDSGESQRFKAFYVIDRSVPVGFRIGEDHNVENTIIVRRILAE